MRDAGSPKTAPIDCHDVRVAVVAADRPDRVMSGLLAGAQRALADHQVEQPSVVRVPGAFELPVTAGALAQRGYDAVVALGVVVREENPLVDQVCSAVADGLARVAVDTGVPVGFGLLTCDTVEQALDGFPASKVDKGYEAASSAVVTALTLRRIRRGYEAG